MVVILTELREAIEIEQECSDRVERAQRDFISANTEWGGAIEQRRRLAAELDAVIEGSIQA